VALFDRAIARMLPAVPRPVVRRLSARYIAGPACSDAIRVVRELNAQGKVATVDVLGEDVTNPDEAARIADAYRDVIDEIERESLDANVSVKPTALGLELGSEHFRANVEAIVEHAARYGRFVRIDMEDSSTTDATLAVYRELRAAGHDNVGIVLQSALRRTLDDVAAVADLRPNTRLCKGIYVEPEEIAFREYQSVRANFVRVLEALFDGGCKVAVATHDEWLLGETLRLVRERGLGPDGYEFQMLLGVRADRGDELVRDGHTVRVYVPFGSHWYEYSLRRLQENPKIAGYVAADTLGRLIPGR
jgi:proline dehydrogenase